MNKKQTIAYLIVIVLIALGLLIVSKIMKKNTSSTDVLDDSVTPADYTISSLISGQKIFI